VTPQDAELIKREINRLTIALDKYEPQAHQQPLELVEAYQKLVEIASGPGLKQIVEKIGG